MFSRLRKKIALWRIRCFERKLNKSGLDIVTLCYAPMRRYNEDGSFTGGKTTLFIDYALEQYRKRKEKLEAERKEREALEECYKILRHRCLFHYAQRPKGWKQELEQELVKDPLLCFDLACMQEYKPGGRLEALPRPPRFSSVPIDAEPTWIGPKFVTSGFKEIYEDDNN